VNVLVVTIVMKNLVVFAAICLRPALCQPNVCSLSYLQHRFIFILLTKLNYPFPCIFVPVRQTRPTSRVNWLACQLRNLVVVFIRERDAVSERVWPMWCFDVACDTSHDYRKSDCPINLLVCLTYSLTA